MQAPGTLADSFLADLDDLSEEEEEELGQQQYREEKEEAEKMEEEIVIGKNDRLEDVAKLANTDRYQSIMSQVNAALQEEDAAPAATSTGPLLHAEDDPTYKLLVDCNQLAVDIENEILTVYNFLRERYRPKFPELESLVHNPLDYAKVVKTIGNEMDVTMVDLDSLLPPATVMVVTVTATTTAGVVLNEDALSQVVSACELIETLEENRSLILKLVQKRMDRIAPNLSAAVGTEIAAQLMGVAGGLHSLAGMPACNVQVLGAKKRSLAGLSSKSTQPHLGFVFHCDLVQNTPPGLRNKAAKLVAAKCTLLARMDAHGKDPSGGAGQSMREEMSAKIEKWQEPPPARKGDVLPLPDADELKKKRRGGKRNRKMKERYGMTELKKQANRMAFGQAEEEYYDGEDTIGLGVIGKEGSGRLRAVAAQQRQKLSQKAAKKYGVGGPVSGIQTSGLSSSLAFTPIQGIELVNPNQQPAGAEDRLRDGTESYFSEYSGFRSSKRPKQ